MALGASSAPCPAARSCASTSGAITRRPIPLCRAAGIGFGYSSSCCAQRRRPPAYEPIATWHCRSSGSWPRWSNGISMIGNDVVDLLDPETQPGAVHPRFDARVFTDDELRALRRSVAPGRLRWLMWAAKESAFKAVRRNDACVAFRPREFAVTLRGNGGV